MEVVDEQEMSRFLRSRSRRLVSSMLRRIANRTDLAGTVDEGLARSPRLAGQPRPVPRGAVRRRRPQRLQRRAGSELQDEPASRHVDPALPDAEGARSLRGQAQSLRELRPRPERDRSECRRHAELAVPLRRFRLSCLQRGWQLQPRRGALLPNRARVRAARLVRGHDQRHGQASRRPVARGLRAGPRDPEAEHRGWRRPGAGSERNRCQRLPGTRLQRCR